MAAIHDTLTLEDRFSATFTKYLQYGNQAVGASTRAAAANQNYQFVLNSLDRRLISLNAEFEASMQQQNAMIAAGRQNSTAFSELDAKMEKLGGTIRDLTAQYNTVEKEAAEAAQATNQFTQKAAEASTASNGLISRLKSLAGAYLGIRGTRKLVDLSDTMAQNTARLNLMNDGLQSTAELNNMIYASAMRSRGAYQATAELVSKLGTLAPDAFSSSAEIVDFAEQINKHLKLSGASAISSQAAILQMTQALSSGVLRGDELRSVLEQAPTIAQTIAEYMGVSVGEMRNLASEGAVTAEVVKNALLGAAEETNEKFNEIPLTWSNVWTMAGNIAIKALQPVLIGINWLANNIETVIPVVLALGTAFAVFEVAAHWTQIAAAATKIYTTVTAVLGIAYSALTGATMSATAAQSAFNTAMLASPITWVLLIILAVIAAIYVLVAVINKLTGASISATGIIVGAFYTMVAMLFNNVIIPIQNGFAAFANFIANVFNDPVAAVKMLFYNMAETVLGYIKTIAHGIEDLINNIPGVEVDITSGLDSIYAKVQAGAQKVKDESEWKEYVEAWDFKDISKAFSAGYEQGANFNVSDLFGMDDFGGAGDLSGLIPPYEDVANNTADTASAAKSIEKSVDMSQEDIKSLVDVAERRYVNQINLSSQTPVINISGQNTGNTRADRQNLANVIRDMLLEQMAAGSTTSTALPARG